MSSAAPGQELLPPPPPPPPAFVGVPVCAPRSSAAPSTAAAAKVAPETWLDSIWAAAASLLDDEDAGAEAPGPGDHFCSLDSGHQDEAWSGDQLSTQLYRNKQLQDTLLQKEEELARLQEENSHLRQFLNSALVKQLEEKTKKLLLQNGQKARGAFRSGKRRLKADGPVPHEAPHPQKARRNLLPAFSACAEWPDPSVDTWVLRTLGLKDVDTIDEAPASANYSALTPDLVPDLGSRDGQPAAYRCAFLSSPDSPVGTRQEPLPYLPPLPCCPPLLPSDAPALSGGLPGYVDAASPTPMDVAFSTSLSPHCNVKTHTFRQGQAFVRRDEDGGWKLTWVPKQPE